MNYKSKCCEKPVNEVFRDGNVLGVFICTGCGKECFEVTSMIDTPNSVPKEKTGYEKAKRELKCSS